MILSHCHHLKKKDIRKRNNGNQRLNSIHLASINPSIKYLTTLINEVPGSINDKDSQNWIPIHYAASCISTAPIEYLIKEGANIEATEKHNMTPLIIASRFGRDDNIRILLDSVGKQVTKKRKKKRKVK